MFISKDGGRGGGGVRRGEGRREKWRKRYCRIRATSGALTPFPW